jgi:hypothetical protein
MSKLVMMSILLATVLIPIRNMQNEDPSQALRRTVTEFCWFSLLYTLALVFVVPRLL